MKERHGPHASYKTPVLLSLLLCDYALREEGTRKISLIGAFNEIFTPGFPCTHPSLFVYIALTDGRQDVECILRMIHLETQKELFSLPGTVNFLDPAGVAELIIRVQQIRFDQDGMYQMEFHANQQLLASRNLRVRTYPKQNPEQ